MRFAVVSSAPPAKRSMRLNWSCSYNWSIAAPRKFSRRPLWRSFRTCSPTQRALAACAGKSAGRRTGHRAGGSDRATAAMAFDRPGSLRTARLRTSALSSPPHHSQEIRACLRSGSRPGPGCVAGEVIGAGRRRPWFAGAHFGEQICRSPSALPAGTDFRAAATRSTCRE